MATIINLALRVYGGASEGSLAKLPFVSVGNVPQEFHPMPPTLVDEQQVWMITHAQDYTLYTISSKRCHTADDLPGQILICLFLPPQKRLADGHSPLGLLDALMDSFIVQALRGGRLPNAPIDGSPFKSLLDKYRLEERPMPLPIMGGHEPCSFCVESKAQLDAIMRHSRYPILSSVGRLELGFQCKSSIALIKQAPSKTPNESSQKVLKPEKINQNNSKSKVVSGGLPLDDSPIVVKHTTWYKRLLKVAAIFIGVIFGLFVLLGVTGMFIDDDNNPQVVEDETISVEHPNEGNVAELEQSEPNGASHTVPIQVLEESKNLDLSGGDRTLPEETSERAKIEAEKRKKEAASKKRAEEMAKKKEEDAEKKREAENPSWQSNIRQYAQSCPIQLRLGVRITSITYTSNTVTYTVNYEELSKYDLDSGDKDNLATDRSNIIKKYGVGLPSGIHTSVVQKDKAGRTL